MKKNISVLLILSFLLSTVGMIADGDPKQASMVFRFVEFFAMTASLFILISSIYFSSKLIIKKLRTMKI